MKGIEERNKERKKQQKNKKQGPGVWWTCETDNLRISSGSRLLCHHSSLANPTWNGHKLWVMQSKFSLSVIIIICHYHHYYYYYYIMAAFQFLLGSDIQLNR